MALYIDERSRTGTLTLYTPGTRPEEVRIGFGFGYPVSDEDGNVTVPVVDEAPAGEPSAVGWLRAFPSRMVLQPGQRQVVRVLVEPPAGIEEGVALDGGGAVVLDEHDVVGHVSRRSRSRAPWPYT